jgi:four helix bundle protein
MQATSRPEFPHHKLDVYRVSTQLAQAARALASQLGHSDKRLADQLHRASTAVPLLIAEGANRRTPGQKRQRFTEARGEAAEAASASELAAAFGLVDNDEALAVEVLADRVVAMLTRLIHRFS